MPIIDNSILQSDVEFLWKLISNKLLNDKVVCNYLLKVRESFRLDSFKDFLLIEWSVRDWEDYKGQRCCETGYLSLSDILKKVEEKDYVPLCEYLVKSAERIYYDAYHSGKNSGVFPIEFMIDKVRRLHFLI
jgi:hypothetical protein